MAVQIQDLKVMMKKFKVEFDPLYQELWSKGHRGLATSLDDSIFAIIRNLGSAERLIIDKGDE